MLLDARYVSRQASSGQHRTFQSIEKLMVTAESSWTAVFHMRLRWFLANVTGFFIFLSFSSHSLIVL